MRSITTATATIVISLLLLLSIVQLTIASPEKLDKFGCHKCAKDCEKYELLKNEFHCHGTVNVQSQNIQIAPRIYGNSTYRRVASVIDGDTLTVYYGVGGKKEKVRLLGIDTPEASPVSKAECYSGQATQQLKKLAFNKFILLEKDKLQKDDKDKYGRQLRYVILFDNTSVNEELVKGGYAKAYPTLTTTVEQYKKLESEAKEKKLGMWGECGKAKKNDTSQRNFPLKGERYGSNNLN